MTTPPQRAKTRTETAEKVQGFADHVRETAAALDALYATAQTLSEPLWRTGWTNPIATIGGLAVDLREWVDRLTPLTGEKP